jgi:hypothetical protein
VIKIQKRFPTTFLLKILSSGMLLQAAGNLTYSDIQKNHSTFIFNRWYILDMKRDATQQNNPEDGYPQFKVNSKAWVNISSSSICKICDYPHFSSVF